MSACICHTTNGFVLIEQLFENLDRWRHLPAYQLERRADVFFGPYLHPMLVERFEADYSPVVVPEFPLKRDLIWPSKPSNQSVKVDYVLFADDHALFVELKTDAASRRDNQDFYLTRAEELGLLPFLIGLLEIAEVTSATQKYMCLLELIAEGGAYQLADDFAALRASGTKEARREAIRRTRPSADLPVRVCYLQPLADDTDELQIGFDEFANWLDARDPLATVFAHHLRRWTTPAGQVE